MPRAMEEEEEETKSKSVSRIDLGSISNFRARAHLRTPSPDDEVGGNVETLDGLRGRIASCENDAIVGLAAKGFHDSGPERAAVLAAVGLRTENLPHVTWRDKMVETSSVGRSVVVMVTPPKKMAAARE